MQNMDIAVVVLIAGMVVVFLMLIILTFIIKLYSTAIHGNQNKRKSNVSTTEKKNLNPQVTQEKSLTTFSEDQGEIVAAISAAIVFLECFDPSKHYEVKSIKPCLSSFGNVSLWGLAGKFERTKPF